MARAGIRALWAAIALCAAASVPAAERVRIAGTRVSLEPPPGFTVAARFPGLERADAGASVVVTEMPAPASEVAAGMTAERLAAAGMEQLARRTTPVDGHDAVLIHARQPADGVHYRKWMLITGDERRSVLVVGSYPEAASSELAAAIERAVASASCSAEGPADPLEGLPFRVRPGSGLKVAARVGNTLLLTATGRPVQAAPGDATCAVATSISPTSITDLRQFAERRLRRMDQVRGIKILSHGKGKLGNLSGYEILASATDTASGALLRVYQALAPHAGGYAVVQATVRADHAARMVPEFRQVAASFRARAVPPKP